MQISSLTEYSNKNAINEVLGSFMQNPKFMREYKVNNEDFPELFHRLVFASINNLAKSGITDIDAVAIDEYLSHYEVQYKVFQDHDGVSYTRTIKTLAKPENVRYYYDQLKKFSLLRRYHENGFNVSEYFDPHETDPKVCEEKRKRLDKESLGEIINHFKLRQLAITEPFIENENRESKKAGDHGLEQIEAWKKSVGWGLGFSSAYLTTVLHGMKPKAFTIKSAGTGVGKTRTALADLAYACSPYYWDSKTQSWAKNPNGIRNGAVYIGTEMELLHEVDPILWAYIADVPEDHIKYNTYEVGEEERVRTAVKMLQNDSNIWLEYLPDFTVGALSDVIEKHVLNHHVKHVFFDYIHTTPELMAEYVTQSRSSVIHREEQVLLALSTKLKQICRDYGVSLNTATQVNGDFKDEKNRDQTIVAGAKSIINKADNALIASRPTAKELKKIEPIILRTGVVTPNLVYSVYKVRGGRWTNVKIWLYVDYSTMRTHDLFVTDNDFSLIEDIQKTYINIEGDHVASSVPTYLDGSGLFNGDVKF